MDLASEQQSSPQMGTPAEAAVLNTMGSSPMPTTTVAALNDIAMSMNEMQQQQRQQNGPTILNGIGQQQQNGRIGGNSWIKLNVGGKVWEIGGK